MTKGYYAYQDPLNPEKVFPNEFSDGIEGAVSHPVRVNIV